MFSPEKTVVFSPSMLMGFFAASFSSRPLYTEQCDVELSAAKILSGYEEGAAQNLHAIPDHFTGSMFRSGVTRSQSVSN